MSRARGTITDVVGVKVGHVTYAGGPTGCTVVLTEQGAVAGVEVRGGAPGTRETDLVRPTNLVEEVHAILLSGGSAFGLDAASGVMRYLEERNIGYETGVAKVPIVPAAILFDLGLGDPKIRPDGDSGYKACQAASVGPVAEGNVGAGTGATVGKMLGMKWAMKAGLGTSSLTLAGGIVVGALVVVNALGDVRNPATGKVLAGARAPQGRGFVNVIGKLKAGMTLKEMGQVQNTTIGVVATNVTLTKMEATKVAQMAHDGLARTINPVHTPYDGDTIFALATGVHKADLDVTVLGAMAAEAVADAVIRAVTETEGLHGLPGYKDAKRSERPSPREGA